jgi:hypothetical protein
MVLHRPRRLVLSWQGDPGHLPQPTPDRASEIEVRFESDGLLATRVDLEHRGFARHGPCGTAYRAHSAHQLAGRPGRDRWGPQALATPEASRMAAIAPPRRRNRPDARRALERRARRIMPSVLSWSAAPDHLAGWFRSGSPLSACVAACGWRRRPCAVGAPAAAPPRIVRSCKHDLFLETDQSVWYSRCYISPALRARPTRRGPLGDSRKPDGRTRSD